MSPRLQAILTDIGTIVLMAGTLFFLTHPELLPFSTTPPSENTAAVSAVETPETPDEVLETKPEDEVPSASEPEAQTPVVETPPESGSDIAERVQNPYTTPPQSFDTTNREARAALVNILCVPSQGSLRPITGSGVIIDPRGVILTNAHVAQYVLLATSKKVGLSCTVRTGSPAQAHFEAEILFIPPVWIEKHASDITTEHALGTGEHDYALLRIVRSIDGAPFPAAFPYLLPDTRDGIGFVDDEVLAASYPAEFLDGYGANYNLYAVTTVTTIQGLLTFERGTIDMFSIGGVIGAQSGSSGGPVVNAWGRLIGIITTTSEAKMTGDRDLRAISLAYINRDMAVQTDSTLPETLKGDLGIRAYLFNSTIAPSLVDLLINEIEK
jgi:hypothetical protein